MCTYDCFFKWSFPLSYKQQKFNLFREENEGYAKLVTELNQAGPLTLLGVKSPLLLFLLYFNNKDEIAVNLIRINFYIILKNMFKLEKSEKYRKFFINK